MNRDPLGIGHLLYGLPYGSPAMPGTLLAAGAHFMTLIPDGHGDCGISTFCKNPLHPGPCKGWKKSLGKHAPGALNAIEKAHKEKVAAKRVARNEAKSAASKALTGRQLSSPLHAKKATIKAANTILGDDEAKAGKKADRVILNKTEIKKYSKIKAAQVNSVMAKHGLPEDTGLEDRIAEALAKDNTGGKDDNYRSVIATSGDSLGAHIANKECKKGDGDCDGKPYEALRDHLQGAAAGALASGDDEELDKALADYKAGKLDLKPAPEPEPEKVPEPEAPTAPALKKGEVATADVFAALTDAAPGDVLATWQYKKDGQVKSSFEYRKGADGKLEVWESPAGMGSFKKIAAWSSQEEMKAAAKNSKPGHMGQPGVVVPVMVIPDVVKKAPAKKKAKTPEPKTGTALQAEKGKDFGLGLIAEVKGNKTLGTKAKQKDFADKIQAELDGDAKDLSGKTVIQHGADTLGTLLIVKAQSGTMAKPSVTLGKNESNKLKELLQPELEDGLKGGDAPKPVLASFKKAIKGTKDGDHAAVTEAKAEMNEHIKVAAAKKVGVDPNAPANVVAAHILFKPDTNLADGKAKARLQVLNGMSKEEFDGLPEGHKKVAADWLENRAWHFEQIGGDNGQAEMEHAIDLQKKMGLPEHKPAVSEPDVLQNLLDGVPEATGDVPEADVPGALPSAKEAFGPDGDVFHDQAVAIVKAMTPEEWNGLSEDEKSSAMDNITDALGNGEPGSNEAMSKLVQLFDGDKPPTVPGTPSAPAAPPMNAATQKAVDLATGAKAATMTKKFEAYQDLEGEDFAALPPETQKLILADLKAAKSKFVNPAKKQLVQNNIDFLTPYAGGGAGAGGGVDTTNPAALSDADKIHNGADWASKFVPLLDVPGHPKSKSKDEIYGASLGMLQQSHDQGTKNKVADMMADIWAGEALKKLNAMHADPLGTGPLDDSALNDLKPALAADLAKKFKGEPGATPVLDAWEKSVKLGILDDADAFVQAAHPGGGADAGDFDAPANPVHVKAKQDSVASLWKEAGLGVKPVAATSDGKIKSDIQAAMDNGSFDSWADSESSAMAAGVFGTVAKNAGVPPMPANPDDFTKIIIGLEAEYAQAMKDGKHTLPSGSLTDQMHGLADEVAQAGDNLAEKNGWADSSSAVKDFKKALMESKLAELAAKIAPKPTPTPTPTPSVPAGPKKATNTAIGSGVDIGHIPEAKQAAMWNDLKAMDSGKFLSDPKDDTYKNLLGLAAAHGTADEPLSVLQVLKSLDAAGSKANGWDNINKWENEFVDWLKTPDGTKFAKANPTADPKLVKKITGDFGEYEGITTDLAALSKKVKLLPGPGTFDGSKPSSDFKPTNATTAFKWKSQMLADQGGDYTPGQASGIKIYTGNSFIEMNSYLRGQSSTISPSRKAAIKQTQDAMRPLPEDTLLIRGTGWGALPEGFQSAKGAQQLIGNTIMDEAFMSTSVGDTPGYGSGNPLWLEIEAPKGTQAAFVEGHGVSSNPGEREMLLGAGQQYRILGVEQKGGRTHVRVRIVTP